MSHLSAQNALPPAMSATQPRRTQAAHMSPLKWLRFFVSSTTQLFAERGYLSVVEEIGHNLLYKNLSGKQASLLLPSCFNSK